jgi:excisionase family DNA binding protein
MNAIARDQGDAGLSERERELDRALLVVLSARLANLEASNVEVRALLGLDPPAPAIGAAWRTIKQTAGELSYSQSTVRKMVASGRLRSVKLGGRVLIAADSIRERDRATASR